MNPQQEIEVALFDAASRIEDPEARRAFINWAFRDAPEEAQRMNAVLVGETEAHGWFQRATDSLTGLVTEVVGAGALELPAEVLESAEISDLAHSLAQRYTIFQAIGGGSGGQVFLAEQLQPVRRKVAIKLLHPGLDTPDFLSAFQRERQILATMNHPNIAAILDAGTTLSGRPYLVMELVEGIRITDYCDARRLDLGQRLELFLQVCSAIQHAHQKGVIHLDIKPSNILIAHANSQPLPKVIDFGIASTGEWSEDQSAVSGTPAYMSPEQAAPGRDIDTRSDCFSLGVVLYELLAGPPPWTPQRLNRDALPASSCVAALPARTLAPLAAARGLAPREWVSRLHGDLDAILAKAISLDRQQRYETVDRLAVDIQRHQRGFPVAARPATRSYLVGCFVARNRLACLAGATVLVALLLATGVSVIFSIREHSARAEAERSRAKVAELLDEATARENIAKAAILLSQNRSEEAEVLLRQHPITAIPPSTDAAYVFRFLGERHALLGNWQEAAKCFERLMISNQLTRAIDVARGQDLLYAGPAVLEAGHLDAYQAMRQDMLRRLEKTRDEVGAEHMLKFCTLTPPPRPMLDQLRPMAEILRPKNRAGEAPSHPFREWFALAVALFDLRDGRHQSAYDNALRGMGLATTPSCRASLKLTLAMAAHSLGKPAVARRELAEAAAMAGEAKPRVVVENHEDYDPKSGSWYSWSVARILEREASALIGPRVFSDPPLHAATFRHEGLASLPPGPTLRALFP
jgi:tetratricopeptide (TPR) repeat protein